MNVLHDDVRLENLFPRQPGLLRLVTELLLLHYRAVQARGVTPMRLNLNLVLGENQVQNLRLLKNQEAMVL